MSTVKRIITMIMILTLLFACAVSVSASNMYSPPIGNVYWANGDIDYDVGAYLYYSNNTTTSITVDKMKVYVSNNGVYDVDRLESVASDAMETHKDSLICCESTGYEICVKSGESMYYTSPNWSSVASSPTYEKNSNDNFAYVNILAGNATLLNGGSTIYCFSTTADDVFDYFFHC